MTNLTITIDCSRLPRGIQSALSRAGYKRNHVTVHARETTCVQSSGGQGARGFNALVQSVDSIEGVTLHTGHYGGQNPFTKSRGAWDPDYDQDAKDVPEDGAIVTGVVGSYASVSVRPLTLARIVAPSHEATSVANDASLEGAHEHVASIAAEAIESAREGKDLTELDRRVLFAYGGLKSGEYRRRHLAEIADGGGYPRTAGVGQAAVDASLESLVARGYLKRSSNGATGITTKGRNSRLNVGGREIW